MEQNKMQQLINYTQSQLPVAAAIKGLSLSEGFRSYQEDIRLLEEKQLVIDSGEVNDVQASLT
jgi:hypothetical protein